MHQYDTVLLEGYFMSQGQKDEVLGRLVRERDEAKKNLSLLQAEARKLSDLFKGLGQVSQPENIWNIALESYTPYLSKEAYESIQKLKTEIVATEQRLSKLDEDLKPFFQ